MKNTPQDPIYHGEGDVFTHTKRVCNELNRMTEFHALYDRQRTELFLAALFHDVGKIKTTRKEGNTWISPHHSSTGSRITRAFLWRDSGICGTPELIGFRETVCALIRYHMLPVHLFEQEDPERKVREIAALGELVPDFSWSLLCILAEADVKGRIADDVASELERENLCRMLAEESQCFYKPYVFSDSFTKHAYLSGRNVHQDQKLFDSTWGEVVLMSGLHGTGKDTWVCENLPELPVVSLDETRKDLHISAEDRQGEVIQAAQEQAKDYLRQKQPFIWNATDLTKEVRQKQIRLFERYGARVRIVYLETGWNERLERNVKRQDAVPEDAVERMLGKTELPVPEEAQTVEWKCV